MTVQAERKTSMKKSMLSLLTVLMMYFYTPVSASIPEDTGLSAVCTNYNVSFAVTGADVDYAIATPDGDNGVLDIIVSNVTETITVTPTFTDNKAAVSGTVPEIINVGLNCGFAITEFEVVFEDPTIPPGRWTINAVDADLRRKNLISLSSAPTRMKQRLYTLGVLMHCRLRWWLNIRVLQKNPLHISGIPIPKGALRAAWLLQKQLMQATYLQPILPA